jgi:predicted nucleotidyltransferase
MNEKRLKKYFAEQDDVAAAHIYGSHARGNERPDRDVDVAVWLIAN